MTLETEFVAAANKAHRRMLQTALFVDDRALEPEPSRDVEYVVEPGSLTREDVGASEQLDDADPADFHDAHDVSKTAGLVGSLADHGVSCTVLAPEGPGPGDEKRILRLAQRTDLIILDWNLGSGVNSRSIIEQLLGQDEENGRLRLIVVYTSELDTSGVASILLREFASAILETGPAGHPTLVGDRFRISIVRKAPEGVEDAAPGLDPGLAPEGLVDHVLAEFDRLIGVGLLQQLAVLTLATVRERAHHFLRRFGSDLDVAFIGHRAQTSHRDAVVLVLDLLGSELAALVRSSDISEVLAPTVVSSRVEELLGDVQNARNWNPGKDKISPPLQREQIVDLLCDPGEDARERSLLPKNSTSFAGLLLDRGGDPEKLKQEVLEAEGRFGLVASFARTSEFDSAQFSRPILEFGSVVRTVAGDYLLCVQPTCDSVRVLPEGKLFVFLPLQASDSQFDFDLMLWDDGRRLAMDVATLGRMKEVKFRGNAYGVVASSSLDEYRYFLGKNGRRYRWIGTAREAHVRRIVSRRVDWLVRVGLDESEFLRHSTD